MNRDQYTEEVEFDTESTNDKFEQFKVKGNEAVERLRELIKEGNVRNVIVKDKDGKTLASFPLTIGVVGIALAPMFAAVGAIAALVTECTIYVEKK